jgi:hypothetical protein
MKSALKVIFVLYGFLGLITFLFQFNTRYTACSGAAGCGLSFVKGIVWSAIWPGYWAIQWSWLHF